MYSNQTERLAPPLQNFTWDDIDTIFLDMDGTLLDKYYDDYFWEQYLPEVYADKNNLAPDVARQLLLETYRSVENTLQWTDLDYWSACFGLDIAALKHEIRHLIAIHPHVIDFFDHLETKGKQMYLVTNAHPKALDIKMARIPIKQRFKRVICSQEVGIAKEQVEFWEKLQKLQPYDKQRTFLADDTEKVLCSAREYGIRHLVHIAKPSTRLPVRFSRHYPSIANFSALVV
ncbi:MAG: HAD family hydrolase [Desulforhopalus sp.]